MHHYFNLVEEWKDPVGAEPMKPTPEWMSAKFDELNSRFFEGKLPKPAFEVKPLGGHTYGRFSFGKSLKYNTRTRMPVDEAGRDLTIYDPTISLNSEMARTEHYLEATLLHEMVHWYVDWKYVLLGSGFPKQAHGFEFKNVCSRINRQSNDEYELGTYRDASMENLVKDERLMNAQERAEARKANQKINVVVVKYKKGIEGFIIMSPGSMWHIMREIDDINNDMHHVELVKYCEDPAIGSEINRMKKFKISRKYGGYYDIAKYPEVKELVDANMSKFENYRLDEEN